ncbi:bifunctional phosphopantothenoylcysteine decarboxylase/phosphopantothenate--cysteine ligase CoaBC [Sandaracinobacter neustonicus]|uniref:Coenzyme A biosynthesis bifunctional protein CoaBC n=1 Tax=Sandaracinobacter neustonicus TaxID=1715348 RepID=A0A501XJ06_9SPHN|nr:bifunctional phosphopantothenoylcysteine decarboxylase/phosphopantothenate--cysteine ligase CoaBC [Sandaracinobacter neustonicus]TPE60622.1 bifunctional phosphopantothenoylcysteine decarboxylase/phosphopantothenate--cysteine ligase CoaBC [Sandaracinobacter neustonicus]
MAGKRILLIIGGGIAAFKSLELIREIRRAGGSVTPVLTKGGQQFVTPLSAAALAEAKAYTDLFDLTDEAEMGHIQLSRSADLLLVCPGTADLIAKMAGGHADDLATTLLLATDTPVLVAPAMNVRMWGHAATARNVATLRERGVTVLEPDVGPMACGEFGPGRLPELPRIMAAIAAVLGDGPLNGRHLLVTAGPTHEPIDPVRYIANRSSGKQGYALAGALAALGARVTLISGPVALATPPGVARVDVETARQMADAVEAALPADAAVMVAAVADWGVEPTGQKIKKGEGGPPQLALRENPDILATLSRHAKRPALVVGFAAETNDVIAHAQAKLAKKGCDLIVANDVSGDVMGGERNLVHLVSAAGVESLPEGPKDDVARALAARIAEFLKN